MPHQSVVIFEGTRSKLPYPNRVISSAHGLPHLTQLLTCVLAFCSLNPDCETLILTKRCFTTAFMPVVKAFLVRLCFLPLSVNVLKMVVFRAEGVALVTDVSLDPNYRTDKLLKSGISDSD